jgi:hypothetical protein
MKKFALTAAVAATVFAGIPAYCSEVATITKFDVTTVKSEPFVQQNILVAPDVATNTTTVTTTKTDIGLVPTLQPSIFVMNPCLALTNAACVVIEVVRPDDLLTRQSELNARILVEQAAGTISAGQANDLLSRLSQVAAIECNMKAAGTLTWRQVEHTYRAFDLISHDLCNYSTDKNHSLAGSFIVL